MLPIRPPLIVHHMAALDDSPYPPNSLEAIHASLEANAACIEVDVTALAADDYLLVHDSVLEHETTGFGEVSACTVEQARNLAIQIRGTITPYRAPLLSEVVALFQQYPGQTRLQLDFKNVLPMRTDEPLRRLIGLVAPLGDRVIVSSGADWHLRKFRRLAPQLDLGFDVNFYLDYRPTGSDENAPPFRLGEYGYHDDHVLATQRLLSTPDYLRERCEILLTTVPTVSTWYVNYQLLLRCLEEAFNMAEWLHEHNVRLDAWTLDADHPAKMKAALTLMNAGVDQFTTNTPLALGRLLSEAHPTENPSPT